MTPVKSPQQFEISENSQVKKMKIIGNVENLLWKPAEEDKEKTKMMEFMRHINKQYNLSTICTNNFS